MRTALLTMTMCLFVLPASAKYSAGTGEPNDPYQIATAEDLVLLGETPEDYDKHFIMTADIDLDPNLPGRKVFDRAVIAPDTDPSPDEHGAQMCDGRPFAGVFDGDGHIISHLTIVGDSYLGLFGRLGTTAKVCNLGLEAVNVNGTQGDVGGLAGSSLANIAMVHSSGSVNGQWDVGGLVGSNNGIMTRCHNTGTISGTASYVGGLAGHNRGGGSIIMSHSSALVDGRGDCVGGLVGGNQGGSLTCSYSTGTVRGNRNIGGLVGWTWGNNWETLHDCYSTSAVHGNLAVGGLAGLVNGPISNCYSTGMVSGSVGIGGLVGAVGTGEGPVRNSIAFVTDCFWDTQTSGQTTSAGGTGKTTAEMQTAKTFLDAGWDFVGETANGSDDIWKIAEGLGYPRLAWQKYSGGTGEPNDPYQIATAADLIALGETPEDYDKHFILIADIDLDPNLPGRKVFDRAVIAQDTNDVTEWFEGTGFAGVFDGNGHTISHLTIAGGSYLGLFGQLEGGGWRRPPTGRLVKNLGLVDVRIAGTGDYVGGLVGWNYGGTVTQCYSSGVVSGNLYVGGLVGMESSPSYWFGGRTIMDCYSTAAVSATTAFAGGLVGYNDYGTITRCYSTGPVAGASGAGGLVGESGEDGGTVADCFWDIETSGQATSAGGTGKTTAEMHAASTFVAWGACVSFWTIDDGRDYPRLAWENAPGRIIAGPTYAGGAGTAEDPYLIGTAEHLTTIGLCPCHSDRHFTLAADIDLSGWTWTSSVVPSFSGVFDGNGHVLSGLTITGEGSLGLFGQLGSGACIKDLGIVDVNMVGSGNYVGGLAGSNAGIVTHCYSMGLVSGNRYVGGLLGSNGGDVSWCYSTCGVSGDQYVGGLAGSSSGDMMRCYSTGPVIGNSFVGGLAGSGSPVGAMHCVWDVETSGLTGSGGGVGLTTGEMMDPNMLGLNGFADDPNWVLDAHRDYPRLAWEGTAGTIIPEPSVDWLEGQGTADEPYRIGTADQLILLGKASVLWDRQFVLDGDIDLDPNLPEGAIFRQAVVPVFWGVFDGNDHAISHLTIQGGSYLGLFGWVTDPNSEIRSLNLIDPNVNGGDRLGALAGFMEDGTVTNCRVVDANVLGTGLVGGLTASHQNGMITDCSIIGGRVSGGATAGGLVGAGNRIIRCSVEHVEVVSTGWFFDSVGGLAASAKEIVDCWVTGGVVRGPSSVGGLAASISDIISGCCTSTRVEGTPAGLALGLNVGGLVGNNAGTIENSYSTSSVTQTDPNGLLLLLTPSGVGGLVGFNRGTIRRSYSTGAVVASTGGALGGAFAGIAGTELDVGGLAGYSYGDAIEHSFWDTETSGQATSGGGTGKTTAEMQMASTFLEAGWDFTNETANGTDDIWWILEGQGYPRLWWELIEDESVE